MSVNYYKKAFDELYAKASPELKKKIDEAKNPDAHINDRDVSCFVKKVIELAESHESHETNENKPKPDLG